ncbi:MAG TPA: 50S ribosomal protein L29 [Deltaproteobacteria bacterium]|nr:50S ribosomal protein L29 [Deltaproteobacteria bacterium]
MKPSKMREKSVQELKDLMEKNKRELMDARFKNAMGQLSDKSILSKLRADVARINTILREKQ